MWLTSTCELWGEIHVHAAAKYYTVVHFGVIQTFQIVKMAVVKSVNVKEMLYLGSPPFKEMFVCICFKQRSKILCMFIVEFGDNSKEHKEEKEHLL